jgi:hypothetical protein
VFQRPLPIGHFCWFSVAAASPAIVLLLPGTVVRPVHPGVLESFADRFPGAHAATSRAPVAEAAVKNSRKSVLTDNSLGSASCKRILVR